jgi:hypothetical protein
LNRVIKKYDLDMFYLTYARILGRG